MKQHDLWKWSKEAMYQVQAPRGVRCLICPNECTLREGELSDCRNRVNQNGKIYSIAYGNPCAIHVDPIEKKPLYHFLPGSRSYSIATAGCNLACLNCQNQNISQKSPRETRNMDLMPEKVIEEAIKYKCQSIAYTYTEPITFYEYVFDTAKLAREEGIKNVFISAGYINPKPLRNICQFLDAANIDLKSFSNDIYSRLNAGSLAPVLKTLKILKEENTWVEITNLIVPNWTDDLSLIREMCQWLTDNEMNHFPLHFSRFHPINKLTQLPPTPVSTILKAREIALKEGIKHVFIGNVPGTNTVDTFCSSCQKLLVDRKGYTVLQKNIVNGNCKFCGEIIDGVWS